MSNSRPNAEEKAWMKENYGGEYHFLASQGLNIHKDDHREEGRAIAQGYMKQDAANAAASGSSSGGKTSGTGTGGKK
ncbi:MAG: hypothetical protein M1821_002206 [Bathelium mastoideum]|nr:MAG: hypothetical protein M1821_002206 [Bathelium mastoideum]KAI9685084.1 MAG: hypothetical protein M1822_005476 [Bathelium mastoideum]